MPTVQSHPWQLDGLVAGRVTPPGPAGGPVILPQARDLLRGPEREVPGSRHHHQGLPRVGGQQHKPPFLKAPRARFLRGPERRQDQGQLLPLHVLPFLPSLRPPPSLWGHQQVSPRPPAPECPQDAAGRQDKVPLYTHLPCNPPRPPPGLKQEPPWPDYQESRIRLLFEKVFNFRFDLINIERMVSFRGGAPWSIRRV